ncbi:MAG TPA: alpha/beta hydrolase [Candidatus Binataceae bacterium]|nr:alpha/beta hydrolase [Candidatus Binataceae bacterium]
MAYLTRDGVKLFYELDGRGAPPVVLVHGWTCNHTYFAPQREHLRKNHQVLSVDLRGHGQSDKPHQEYSIAGFADDVAWMARELGLAKPVVMGHSMGGMITVALAQRHPELPAAIVVSDAPLVLPPPMSANLKAIAQSLHQPDWRDRHRELLRNLLFIASDDAGRRERIIDDMCSAPDHVAVGCFDAIANTDLSPAVESSKIPFLFIGAENPPSDTVRMRQLCPSLVVGQTAGAGHFHQLEVPEQVNAMIDRFLQVTGMG